MRKIAAALVCSAVAVTSSSCLVWRNHWRNSLAVQTAADIPYVDVDDGNDKHKMDIYAPQGAQGANAQGVNPQGANAQGPTASTNGPGPSDKPKETPVYKKWWFWAVVAVSAYVVISIATEDSQNPSARGHEMFDRGPTPAAPGGLTLMRF